MNKKKSGPFAKIETREEAITAVKGAAVLLSVAPLISVIVVAFFGNQPGAIWEVAIWIVCALALWLWHSRVAAVILLILALLVCVSTVMSILGLSIGGRNIVLAFVVLVGAIRAVQATFALNGRLK